MKRMIGVMICLAVLGLSGSLEAVSKMFKGYSFESYVVVRRRGRLSEKKSDAGEFLQVREGDAYSIVIRNPLPVTVGVAVTVDGLNTIDGKRTTPDKASKWILKPRGSMTIRGWQTGGKSLRRFVFTRGEESYANWKEKHDGRRYTRNLGVIGVAFFWDGRLLDRILNPPKPFSDSDKMTECEERLSGTRHKSARSPQASRKAGTGMGDRETNRVRRVHFHYDTGMYSSNDVLRIYYKFEQYCGPKPFIDEDDGFAPEMPVSKKSGKKKWFPFLKK